MLLFVSAVVGAESVGVGDAGSVSTLVVNATIVEVVTRSVVVVELLELSPVLD